MGKEKPFSKGFSFPTKLTIKENHMFIDKVEIHIKAGNGGNGCVAFHREKYVAEGGHPAAMAGAAEILFLRLTRGLIRCWRSGTGGSLLRRTAGTG